MAAHRTNWQACKRCKRSRAECGGISTRGYCYPCAIELFEDNLNQRMHGSGPLYEKWVMGVARWALGLTESITPHR